MPFIVLNATDRSNTYPRGTVSIREKQYDHCYMFKRYEHTFIKEPKPEIITIYKEYTSYFPKSVSLSLNLRSYKTAKLEKAHVYYSNHESKTPLLLVLYFKGGGPKTKNRYYRRSFFESDINAKRSRGLDNLTAFTDGQDEKQLFQTLLEECVKYINIYAYQIEKTGPSPYNNIAISRKQDIKVKQGGNTHGLHFYRHTPTVALKDKKACVLYNQQVLLYWNTGSRREQSSQINQVQNIFISSMTVYYSLKIKEPLMICLQTKEKDSENHLYYFHKLVNKTLYWQTLDSTSFNNLLGQSVGSDNIHNKLTSDQNQLLIDALKKIESDLTKILIIVVDSTGNYSEKDVGTLKGPAGDTSVYRLANPNGTVAVKNVSTECDNLRSKTYTVYEHDMSGVVSSLQPNEALRIKFITSKPEKLAKHDTMVTIDLDYQFEGAGYYSKSLYILVSNANNPIHKFKWYKHNCGTKITDKNFMLHFKGHYVKVEGDNSDSQLNHRVILVYFVYDYRDSFVLLAFPSLKSDKIRILKYSDFEEKVISGKTIKVSELHQMDANTEIEFVKNESGYRIDQPLLDKLKAEHESLKSKMSDSTDYVPFEKEHQKLYVYLDSTHMRTLMICYNNKAYTRLFIGPNRSSWKPVGGTSKCICNSVESQDGSSTSLVKSLDGVLTSLSLRESKISDEDDDEESKGPVKIDISLKNSTDYDHGRITVTEKEHYSKSNLFVYCTHKPKGKAKRKVDSLITSIPIKTMKLESLTEVKSVTVYFNKYNLTKPLVICIGTNKGKDKYYKDLIKVPDSYSITQDSSISSDNLLDKLIQENDNTTDILTYHVDRIMDNDSGTYNGGKIKITKQENDPGPGFTKYTHTPEGSHSELKACVLYNRDVLLHWNAKENPAKMVEITQTQYINIRSISSYYSTTIREPLMIYINKQGDKDQEHMYYFQKRSGKQLFWQLFDPDSFLDIVGESIPKDIHGKLSSDNKLLIKALGKIETYLTKMVVILLDKKNDYSEEDVICSIGQQNLDTYNYNLSNYANISVKDVTYTKCKILYSKNYSVYEHDLTDILKHFIDSEPLKIKFITSSMECESKEEIVIVNLDIKNEHAKYYSKSFEIYVSNASNPDHKYIWYRHGSFSEITKGKFRVHIGGKSLTFNGDVAHMSHNKVVIAYFKQEDPHKFILLGFPDRDSTHIWYITYSKFIESVYKGMEVSLSNLTQIEAGTKSTSLKGGIGYHIDESLLRVLQKEYENLRPKDAKFVDVFDYQKGQKKFYVYLYSQYSRPLMICYNNRGYKPYDLSPKCDRWVLVDGITRCICDNNLGSKDASDKKVLESLSEVGKSLDLIDPLQTGGQDDPQRTLLVDISTKGPTEYANSRIIVSAKEPYSESNLFFYCTHTFISESPLYISSLSYSSQVSKVIKLKEEVFEPKSVTVYFNKFIPETPVILCIKTKTGEDKYFKNLIQRLEKYEISEDKHVSSRLCQELFEESERSNNIWIYRIDKTVESGTTSNYGHSRGINISKVHKTTNGFTTYGHKPIKAKGNKAFILYKECLLVGKSRDNFEPINDIQKTTYNEIIVYILDRDTTVPLLIELKDSKSSKYYSYKKHESHLYWQEETTDSSRDDIIIHKLNEIYYHLNSSAIIEIDKRGGTKGSEKVTYVLKTIINTEKLGTKEYQKNSYTDGYSVRSKKISISEAYPIMDTHTTRYSQYKYFSHEIPVTNSKSASGVNNTIIAGIRLFLKTVNEDDPVEIELYPYEKPLSISDRLFLYYPPLSGSQKLFVYFHGEDPRPLGICYDKKMYKRLDNNYNTKWVCSKGDNCSNPANVFNTLKTIYLSMSVKVTFVKEQRQTNIAPKFKQLASCKWDRYEPEVRRHLQSKLSRFDLIGGIADKTIIDHLLDNLDNGTFDSINIYYEVKNKPFFFEFIDGSTKTQFQSMDPNSKYWVKENVEHARDVDIGNLETIKANVNKTIVYEIDKKDNSYNDYITLQSYNESPVKGFTKRNHSPKPQHSSKNALVLYKLDKLKKSDDTQFSPITEIGQLYQSVDVYFGTKTQNAADLPLLVVFNKKGSDPKIYRHKMYNSSYYWEEVKIESKHSENKQLINKLKETESDLVQSIVFLMDRRVLAYGKTEIDKAVRNPSHGTGIKLAPIGVNGIKIKEIQDSRAKCAINNGYKVYEHNLSSFFTGDKYCSLRFFILTEDSPEEYTEIKLYDSSDVLETVYYEKNAGNDNDKVYLYFYGEDYRPLLVCYNGSAYSPKTKESYFQKWYRDGNIKKCLCENDEDNQDLIKALTEVVKLLNVVKLEEATNMHIPKTEEPETKGKIEYKYSVQKFSGKDICIKVTHENKKCYRVYTHQPDGIYNKGNGFRLGNIKYDTKPPGIDYKTSKPLSSVSMYYSVHDTNHKNPFLVALEFEAGDPPKEYFKLTKKDTKLWVKMEVNGSDKKMIEKLISEEKIEEGLYDLRKDLKIDFEDKDKITPLFNPEKCTEDNVDWVAIGAGSGGAAAVIGTGVTIGIVVAKKLGAAAVTTVVAAAAAAA